MAGFCLFFGLMIDRQHYYIKEITSLRKNFEKKVKKVSHNQEPPKKIEAEIEKKK